MGGVRSSDARVERLAAWQQRVEAILREASSAAAADDYCALAATVVGMFDAGARDEEVAAFLESRSLGVTDAVGLATSLHRAAAGGPPTHVAT